MSALPVQVLSHAKFQNILFATDFSACSLSALPYARAIAERYGSTVHVVHVLGPDPIMGPLGVPIPDPEVENESARCRLDQVMQSDACKGLLCTQTIQRGLVWDVVARLVPALQVDLIVLGTHGRRGLSHFVLGSVAEQVFRHATCPVMTVGPEVHKERPAPGKLTAVLYATDFSPASRHAFDYALSLARTSQAKLTLLHVLHSADIALTFDEAFAEAKWKLSELMPKEPDLNHEVLVVLGKVGEMILSVAKDTAADLIVMGAHHGRSMASHMPWAVAHQVVCHAPCPVLTIRG
jgi:nucleotide-binding universal stress UspA family protein